MTTVQHGAKMTLAEYRALCEIDDGVWELADGALYQMPPPTYEHQLLIDLLVMAINRFTYSGATLLGRAFTSGGVALSELYAPTPDLVYVRFERLHLIRGSFVEGIPDLVAEALSSDRNRDLVMKRAWYAEAWVPEYWTIDPVNDSITILELSGREYVERAVLGRNDTLTTATIPGFELPLEQLFGDPVREQIRSR